jgi:hypothetical protein
MAVLVQPYGVSCAFPNKNVAQSSIFTPKKLKRVAWAEKIAVLEWKALLQQKNRRSVIWDPSSFRE